MALQRPPCSEHACGPDDAWTVYLLQCADGTLYCGITTDITRRLNEHNGHLPGGARYTRSRRPVHLLASTTTPDRATACKLEEKVKRLPRKRKLPFLQQVRVR